MSRTVHITIDERTFARLIADANVAAVHVETYLSRILISEARERDEVAARAIAIRNRNADPPRITMRRPSRTTWRAVDLAIAHAGRRAPLTARIMGDPEPGRRRW